MISTKYALGQKSISKKITMYRDELIAIVSGALHEGLLIG